MRKVGGTGSRAMQQNVWNPKYMVNGTKLHDRLHLTLKGESNLHHVALQINQGTRIYLAVTNLYTFQCLSTLIRVTFFAFLMNSEVGPAPWHCRASPQEWCAQRLPDI